MKAPKEIYLLGQDLEFMVEDGQKDLYHIDASLMDVLGRQVKYLSEESVNEMLAEKDKREQELEDLVKLAQQELYLIHSQYGDKLHAEEHSVFLTKAKQLLNK